MPSNLLTVHHTFGGGWAPDFGPSVDLGPSQSGELVIPYLLEAENNRYSLDGGPVKIGGADKLNAAVMESGAAIRGLFDFWRLGTSASPTQKRIVHVGTKILKDAADGTFTDLFTGLTSNSIPSYSVFGDALILSQTGNDVPRWYDNTTAQNLAGSPPNFAFSTAHKNRVWAAGVTDNPSRLYYCALLDEEDWTGAGSGFIDIEPDDGEGVESSTLLMRREQYPAPAGVACITMGVDVQDDRLEALVIGWGPGEESWLLDRQELPGDTSQPGPWEMLDELLEKRYRHETDQGLQIQATCIDSAGHRIDLVYDYASRKAARRAFAIIGRAGGGPIVSSPSRKKRGPTKKQVPLFTIGIDDAKALWVSRYKITEKGPGYVHVPLEAWADEELAAQLTAERLVTRVKAGFPIQVWQPIRARNEMLDCAVYALAALKILHPDLKGLAARLHGTEPPPAPPPPPRRETWLGRRRGWLRR